jgi:hypothetical protein
MNSANLATFLKNTAADDEISLSDAAGPARLLVHADSARLNFKLTVLDGGSCEALKLGVHAATLGLAVVMGAYNTAAWLRRREPHLAVNAVLYVALIALEQHHVAHHMALLRKPPVELR